MMMMMIMMMNSVATIIVSKSKLRVFLKIMGDKNRGICLVGTIFSTIFKLFMSNA